MMRVDHRGVSAAARLAAALIALVLLSVMVAAAWLRPAPQGHATHTQLGLPGCGWAVRFGKPCPTCGMTTSFAHAAHASYGRSLVAQPFATLLIIGTAAGFWAALHVLLTGSRVGETVASWLRPRLLWVLAATGLAAWIYKFITWN